MSQPSSSDPAATSAPRSYQQLRLGAVGMRQRCTITARVEGPLDKARWERALEALKADEPMLQAPEDEEVSLAPDLPLTVHWSEESTHRHRLEISLSPFRADGRAALEVLTLWAAAYEDPAAVETDRMPYEEVVDIFQTLLESDETEDGRDYWLWFRPPTSPRWRSEGNFAPIAHEVGVLAASSEAFLLACWSVVLTRRDEEGGNFIGRGVDGRTYDEVVDCIGPLAKYLPTRTDAAPSEPFSRLLERIEEAFEDHLDYQDFFALPSEGSAPATFPILFDTLELPAPMELAEGTRLTVEDVETWVDRSLLRLRCLSTPDGWRLVLHGDPKVYDSAALQVLGEQLVEVARQAAQAPETPIRDLSLLPPAHRQALLVEANATAVPLQDPLCIHRLVADRARNDPQRSALLWGEETWSYARLDHAAATLAGALRHRGIGLETVVGVLLPRSPEMVIALLGVFRAGATMLPLDPDMLEERRNVMVDDSGCDWVITHRPLLGDDVGIGAGPTVLDLADSSWQEGIEPFPPTAGYGESLAYVIYTSGSTGRPKGVEVPHGAVVNFLRSMAETPGLGPDDRLAAVTTISFDISILELFLPLMVGAEILLVERSVAVDGGALGALLDHRRPTVMQATPSTWRMLMAAGWTPYAGLKILSGGEALPGTLAADLLNAGADLWNVYGPTETTIWSSALHAAELSQDADSMARRAALPLGRPIANTELYILSPELRPVGYGETGELVIGGLGVTRGYHGLPAMTADRFRPDPFSPRSGSRMYRTGDLVRCLPGRTPDYLGRADFQVKIRGHRIELGEIETALRGHQGVSEAVVVARPDAHGVPQLVAYTLRPVEGEAPSGDTLREHLTESLPGPMVPAHFVVLDTFPLTANNKIDRRALPDPEPTVSEASYEAPRTEFEERLAELWQEVLSVERIGRQDHFFTLGGHSLSATVLLQRTRKHFGIRLPLSALFDAPTLGQFAVVAQGRRLEEAGDDELAAALERLSMGPATAAELTAGAVEQLEAVAAELGFSRQAEERIAVQPRHGDVSVFPMSFAQQRLWFIDRYLGESPAYNLVGAARIRGPLDRGPLEEAIHHIVRRHEVLRTTYATLGDEQVQRIHPHVRVPVVWMDVEHEPDPERAALALASEEARRPFDLESGPVLRACLVRLAAEDHIFVVNIHHIASDAWSNDLFMEELGHFYRAAQGNDGEDVGDAIPELPIQYADFSVWQRRWLDSGVLEPQIAFWRRALEDAEDFPLPLDRPRSRQQTFDGGRWELRLPARLEEQVEAFSNAQGVTPFMTLLGALAVVFYRYSGHSRLVIGSPFAGRRGSEVERLIGFFINNLPIPVDMVPDAPFLQLLDGVKKTLLEVQDNQDLPFERLLDELAVERDPSKNPLYQVVFNYQNATPPALAVTPELSMELLEPDPGAAKFDLTLALQGSHPDDRRGFVGFFEYKPSLFDRSTIATLAEHFQRILEGIVTSQGTLSPAALPLLSESARATLLSGCHGQSQPPVKSAPYAETCIHDRFEAAAAHYPEGLAVSFEGESLTYADLARRARQTATLLRRYGVGPEVRVGLCFERGLDLVVAILGVLRAGGTYVPLDPTYPEERLRFIAEDADMRLILTQEGCEERLPEALVRLWRPEEIDQETPLEAPAGTLGAHAAYIIYTSGSTGQPKGVVIPHHNVLRLFSSTQPWFEFGPEDVWTLFHSYAFDFSVWELWGALFFGGRLVVVPYWVSRSPESLYQLLLDEGVTVLNQSPSAFSQLVHYHSQPRPVALPNLHLRTVIFGGEALDVTTLRPWFERQGDQRPQLVNMYGITETTVHVTYRPLGIDDVDESNGSPVGVAIPDLTVYVLDDFLQPVPFGCPGEVYVGGAGAARGYLDRPALTAQRFLPDPFSDLPGSRLYRSGDKAFLKADGDIAFLGRLDDQVQIRGFRIELGEVQAALAEHPDLHQVVVTTSPDPQGDPMLVAFYVPVAEPPEPAELREFLAGKIPGYMIPRQMLPLEEFPLTSHGKLDRRALPKAEDIWAAGERREISFESPLEETLAKTWEGVLGVEGVGPEDNFFDLGGDSILGIRMVAEAKQQGLELSLQELFQGQTIRALATELQRTQTEGDGAGDHEAESTPPFSLISEAVRRRLPSTVVDAYPTSRLQLGMIYEMQLEPETLPYHNVDSVRYRAPLDPSAFLRAVELLVERHDILRTGFELSRYGDPLQVVHREAELPTHWQDLRGMDEAEQRAITEDYIEAQRHAPFDLAKPTLLRFAVHRLTDDIFRFTVTECHAILDGWSLTLLMRDLFTFHESLRQDAAFIPPALPKVRFRDFVRLELESVESRASSQFWQEHLADFSVLSVPAWPITEAPDPAVASLVQRFQVDGARVERLKRLAQRAQVPLKTVCLTAHMRALALLGGRHDVLTGVQSNGRPEVDGGDAVTGLFLNSIPLRVILRSGNWVDLLRQVFEAERQAMPHRRYPLADIQRDVKEQPLFETFFNYVSFHMAEGVLESGSIEILPDSTHLEPTHFPLSVDFNLSRTSGELTVQLECNKALYPMEQVMSMARLYERVLDAMTDLDTPVLDHFALPFVDDDERRDMARHLIAPATYDLGERTFLDLLAQQVAERPHQDALVQDGSERLTYLELDRASKRLAKVLRQKGARPEVSIGLFLERGYQAIVGMLGILQSGGVYLPIDPAYPKERTDFLVEDSGLEIVLTREALVPRLPEGVQALVFETGEWGFRAGDWSEADASDAPSHEAFPDDLSPDNLAYSLYTSGSTGVPKGVGISHRSLANLCFCLAEVYGMKAGTRGLQTASLSFDISIEEVFPLWAHGGTLVLPPTHFPLSGMESVALIERQGIHFASFPTAYWHAMVLEMAETERRMPVGFRCQVVGGEKAKPAILETARQLGACEDFAWFNTYGPTETSVASTYFGGYPGQIDTSLLSILPIGKSFQSYRHYVLDGRLQPVPTGVVGQLYIAGVGLARGYLGRPSTTAQSFLPDPFVDAPLGGERMYATRDLVRMLPDGNLEYIGRADSQVKIRGFRIETGEIEAVALRHGLVGDATVTVFDSVNGDPRLALYYTSPEGPLEHRDIQGYLRRELPEHMVPNHFVRLDELPLTPNGKVDRRALPAPEVSDETRPHVEPQTDTERSLAEVWSTVLSTDSVSRDDDFFALGGHSLLATQVVSRIRDVFRIEVPLRALFEHSQLHELAAHLDSTGDPIDATTVPPLVAVERTKALPLSFSQERLWFLDQLTPGDASYNMPDAVRMVGPLDPDRLQACFAEIVRRHEVLRTVFVAREGQAEQRILEPFVPPLPVSDLRDLPIQTRHETAVRMAREEAARPFQLDRLPLLRTRLLRLDDEEHVVLLTMHHIVSDGWSSGILIRELGSIFSALDSDVPFQLEPLPIQYGDFAHWQRNWLRDDALEALRDFWIEQLEEAPTVLELPADRPRSTTPSHRGATVTKALGSDRLTAVEAFAARHSASPFMVLLAAWGSLLGRLAGQPDLLIGSPIANRNRVETEGLIGFFVNTLAMRVDGRGNPSFETLLARVRELSLGAFAHQDMPFELLVDALEPSRDLNRSPIFQVLFSVQNTPSASLSLPGLELSDFAVADPLAKFELSLAVESQGENPSLTATFFADLFEGATIDRWLDYYLRLVDGALEEPTRPLASFSLLAPSEEAQVMLVGSETPQQEAATLHGLFEAQAERTAERTALVFAEDHLTYGDLEARSRTLVVELLRRGVGAESRVGVCLERSLHLPIALYGTLRAGAVFVPMDPEYPAERLAFMAADSAPDVILASPESAAVLEAAGIDTPVLQLDDMSWEPTPLPPVEVSPDHGAYVIYTSGSTGRPKGVLVPHRGIVNHIRWMQRLYPLNPDDRVLQKTAYSFDASLWELFTATSCGACLVLARPGGQMDMPYLAQTLRRQRITALRGVPSFYRALVETGGLDDLPELRLVLSGGEPLTADLSRRLQSPGRQVVNVYGPTEASIVSAAWTVELDAVDPIPIGVPVDRARLAILDSRGWPTLPGAAGELCVGGAPLARGYLGRPALTAERFVPNPWGDGERLYRTGDLVRRRVDDALEFLGRIDHQVKVRGFRIELGEIENALRQHPAVDDAVTLVREDRPGDQRLVTYWVGDALGTSVESLRRHLTDHLPKYMLPGTLMELDEWPLLPNGKVDRRRLPVPSGWLGKESGTGTAPRTSLEGQLAELWDEVLGLDEAAGGSWGVHDDFFTLGGHSLLAVQVMTRIGATIGVDLPVRMLFEAPTVAELAPRVEEAQATGQGRAQPPPLEPRPAEAETPPLSFAQERLWFLDRLEPGSAAYNIADSSRLRGHLDVGLLERALGDMVRRHEALRTVFIHRDGKPTQVVRPPEPFQADQVDLTDLTSEASWDEARRLATEEALRPFDLERGPLLRLKVIRLAPDDHVVVLNMHHIVFDGWSTGILTRELGAIFNALNSGAPPELEPLPIQYGDFAYWQRNWLQEDALEALQRFWVERLEGAPTVLELPTDCPRSATPSHRGATVTKTLGSERLAAVEAFAARHSASPFMVLLAAWGSLLGRLAGQPDLLIGSPIANRNRVETEGLIGFFVNTLAMRVDGRGNPSFETLLERVRDLSLDAFAHQDMPFELLVDALEPTRDLSRSPIFQVLFVVQNTPSGSFSLPGLDHSAFTVDEPSAKFELSLAVEPRGENPSLTATFFADLFEDATIDRWLDYYLRLVDGALEEPTRPLASFSLLAPSEEAQVMLVGSETPQQEAATLHGLFEAQAERTAERTALVFNEDHLTYGDLEARSRALAVELLRRGVGTESRVGVCLERSLLLPIALYGTLRAGAVFVPMDPEYPAERLAFMATDSAPDVILASPGSAAVLEAAGIDTPILQLDDMSWEPTPLPPVEVSPDHGAYVIYTSGSTGRPKGVLVPHRGIVNHIRWMQRLYPLNPDDRVLQKTAYSFDASLWELFTATSCGACLVLARPGGQMDMPYLAQTLRRQRITALRGVPSFYRALVETGGLDDLPELRLVLSGGEPLTADLSRRLQSPGRQVVNVYGPTEASIVSAAWTVELDAVDPIPIGVPVDRAHLAILDSRGWSTLPGAAGELCVGGAPLARGYLGRPALTAERFVPNPWGDGERLYRTGDLVRRRADDALEFLGRIDHQVKVRGFRIELGEIENALRQHPAVDDAVVVALEQRLVAYCVPSTSQDLAPVVDPAVLRADLLERLPDYMVPSLFVALDRLPLLPNGKVDRGALPAPSSVEGVESLGAEPTTALEKILVDLWADVLGRETLGIHDDFFTSGGHSLMAVQLMTRIASAVGVELPLHVLFDGPTVAKMATHLESALIGGTDHDARRVLVEMQSGGGGAPLALVHPVGGHVFSYVALARALGPEVNVYGLQALAQDEATTLEALATQYVIALRRHDPEGPYRLGGWSLGGVVAFEMARQLVAAGASVESLVLIDSYLAASLSAPSTGWIDRLESFAVDLAATRGIPLEPPNTEYRSLGQEEALKVFHTWALESGLLPSTVDLSQLRELYGMFSRHRTALEAYVPSPIQGIPAVLYRATADEAESNEGQRTPQVDAWQAVLEDLEVHNLATDHFGIIRPPHVLRMATDLRRIWRPTADGPEA